jgi:cell division protein FtsQ
MVRVVAAVVAVLAIVFAGVAVYDSSLFAITSVEVVGSSHLTPDAVRRLAAVPSDATLIRFPADSISARVAADPWVATVAVTRVFPDAMRIRIVERAPVGVVRAGTSSWLIDGTGFVMAPAAAAATSTLPAIQDVAGLDLKAGRRTTSEPLLNAVRVLAGITPQLLSTVRTLSAPTIDGTFLLTKDKVEIVVGEAVSLEAKSRGALGVLAAQRGRVVSIDVRDPGRIVSRGLK